MSTAHSVYRSLRTWAGLLLMAGGILADKAQCGPVSDYYRHVIFDNAGQARVYFHSIATASGPSSIENIDEHLPVETDHVRTPPSALRLSWTSRPGGSWDGEIHVMNFPNRFPEMKGGMFELLGLCTRSHRG